MSPITRLYKHTSQVAPLDVEVPLAFTQLFDILHKIHRVWHWKRRSALIYEQPSNFQKLLAGYTIQYVVGNPLLLRLAAHVALIGIRLMDLAHQKACFHYACHYWMEAAGGHIAIQIPRIAVKRTYPSIIPVSTALWVQYRLEYTTLRVCLVVRASVLLISESFKLSMCLMDTVEAFSFDQKVQDIAIQEIFISTTRVVEHFIQNKELLIKSLEENHSVVEWFLKALGSTYKIQDITGAVRKTMDHTETIYQGASQASNLVKEELKSAAWSFCFVLWGTAPTCLLPEKKILKRIKKKRIGSIHGSNHYCS